MLWERGPSTVRAVQGRLQGGYTTFLKLLQIMTEKGLVRRQEQDRAHIYEAAFSRQEIQTSLLDDLMDRAFGGSAAQLALRALESERTTPEDLEAIRRMLAERDTGV